MQAGNCVGAAEEKLVSQLSVDEGNNAVRETIADVSSTGPSSFDTPVCITVAACLETPQRTLLSYQKRGVTVTGSVRVKLDV